jgi:hypothetical protein
MILFPLARQIQGYLKAVVQAEITLAEKARCGIIVMAQVASVVTRRVRAVASKLRESGRRVADRSRGGARVGVSRPPRAFHAGAAGRADPRG